MRTHEDIKAEPTQWTLGYSDDPCTREQVDIFVLSSVSKGWGIMLRCLLDRMNTWCRKVHISQVKEKFGTLRFYATWEMKEELDGWYVPDIEQCIHFCEMLSAYTCEWCGAAGKLRDQRRWLLTLCDDCDAAPHRRSG